MRSKPEYWTAHMDCYRSSMWLSNRHISFQIGCASRKIRSQRLALVLFVHDITEAVVLTCSTTRKYTASRLGIKRLQVSVTPTILGLSCLPICFLAFLRPIHFLCIEVPQAWELLADICDSGFTSSKVNCELYLCRRYDKIDRFASSDSWI